MRPDEHKKKRSAQYNKKHGGKKETQPNEAQQKKGPKSKVDQHTQKQVAESAGKGGHVIKSFGAKRSPSASESSDTDEDTRSDKRTFSRRQLVSNWDRYEIKDTEEVQEQRGEDFAKLLSAAGDAAAQFRFKSEEDWEDTGYEGEEPSEFLAVDLTQLADSLKAIPLYKRLCVDKDLFSNDQLETMDEEANLYREENHLPLETDRSREDELEISDETIETKGSNSSNADKTSVIKQVNTETGSVNSNAEKNTKTTGRSNDICSETECSKVKGNGEIHNLENDLDFLLSLDNPSNAPSTSESPKGDALNTKTKTAPHENDNTTKKEEKSETENLEDWLDDFLDD